MHNPHLLLSAIHHKLVVDHNDHLYIFSISRCDVIMQTWGVYTRGNIEAIVDPVINETCGDQTEVLRCVQVALLCTQADPLLRPSMSTVNLMLSTGTIMLPDPTKPAFVSSVAASNNPGSSRHGSSHTSAATASSSSSSFK